MFYGNLAQLGKESNSVIRSRSVMVKNWCNVILNSLISPRNKVISPNNSKLHVYII